MTGVHWQSEWPSYEDDEIQVATDVLRSNKVNYWTGNEARNFEREFASWSGCKHAIALANGTVALDLALCGLGVGERYGGSKDDQVIVTPRSFIASVSTVVTAGATPIFADVCRETGNLTAQTISSVLTENTRAIILVHLAGIPCEIDPIIDLIKDKDIKLIEDCAQAHGAIYKGLSVGSFGDVAAWSFCQDKIMTTGGEGGMVTTNNEELWSKMWSYKDHGKSWASVYNEDHPAGFRWLHKSFGTNWRMTEFQAAIGRLQIKKLRGWTNARLKNSRTIKDVLHNAEGGSNFFRFSTETCVNCSCTQETIKCSSAGYKYYVYVNPDQLPKNWSRDRIVSEFTHRGVPCFQGSCSEVYLEEAFLDTDFIPTKRLKIARELGETSVMFLVHPTISETELEHFKSVASEIINEMKNS